MFINFTNHPSANWLPEQISAAEAIAGEVRDLPFPAVPTTAKTADIVAMSDAELGKINILLEAPGPHAVLCQGEFTLAFRVTAKLLEAGVRVVSAVSERNVREYVENGVVRKEALFVFAGFRDYSL